MNFTRPFSFFRNLLILNCCFLAAFADLSAAPGTDGEAAPQTLAIGRLSSPPRLDGDLADWPANAASFLLGQTQQTGRRFNWEGTADASGRIYLAWDENFLYLAAEVIDNQYSPALNPGEVWQGDTLELFFNIHPLQQRIDGFWQQAVIPPAESGKPVTVTGPQKDFTGVEGTAAVRPNGYTLEARIPWKNLDGFRPEFAATLGFQLYLDDRDGKGRKTQLMWYPSAITFSHPRQTNVLVLRDDGDTASPHVLAGPNTWFVTHPREMNASVVTDVAGASSASLQLIGSDKKTAFDLRAAAPSLSIGQGKLPIEGLDGPKQFLIEVADAQGRVLASNTFESDLGGEKFQKMRDANSAVNTRIKTLGERKDLDPEWVAGVTAWQNRLNAFISNEARPIALTRDLLEAMLAEYANLEAAILELESGKDPYANRTGSLVRAYRSPLTGEFRPYALNVPERTNAKTPRPLIVLLHSIFADERFLTPLAETFRDLGAIVYQGASYRQFDWGGVSAAETWAAFDELKKHYSIDENRIYLAGCHIGGRGTWQLAQARPDVWAGLAPIFSGIDTRPNYPALRLYPEFYETARQAQIPFPTFRPPTEPPKPIPNPLLKKLFAQDSLVTRIENISHLPIVSAYGEDEPDAAAERLAMQRRFAELGVPLRTRYIPGAMHGTRPEELDDPSFYRDLLAFTRSSFPPSVKYTTVQLRDHSAWWVSVDQLSSPDGVAEISGSVSGNQMTVATSGTSAISLLPDSRLAPESRALDLKIDGQSAGSLALNASPAWQSFVRKDGQWCAGSVPESQKHPGLSGPIDDFQRDRFIFVYGTIGDDDQRAAAKKQAEKLANWGLGAQFLFRADAEITDTDLCEAHLILIGSPATNALLKKLESKLPLRWKDSGLELGKVRVEGPGAGACLIIPNPLAPQRYAVVLTATDADGYQVWTARNPGGDYVLGKAGEVEGKPKFLPAHRGWFSNDWKWASELCIPEEQARLRP